MSADSQTTRQQRITLWALNRFESAVRAAPTRESQSLVKLPKWLSLYRYVLVLFRGAIVSCLIHTFTKGANNRKGECRKS